MDTETQVLLVTASSADGKVLRSLVKAEAGTTPVVLNAVVGAQGFYDALYSECQHRVIVIDQKLAWLDWPDALAACASNRPDALLVLLTSDERPAPYDQAQAAGAVVVYPRNSAGLLALAMLIGKLAAHDESFSLERDPDVVRPDAGEATAAERERLVYAVSHDLQDPLQLARRYAEVLNEDFESQLGEPGTKVLGHLQFNLNRTQEMLDELLDYSRLQNADPERAPVDLDELLDEVTAMYRLSLDEIGGSLLRQTDLPTLVVDRRQFLRLLQNLVGNAIKFRADRPLQITVRAQRVRDEWRIGVKDNGIGVQDSDSERIFGMFERAGGAEEQPGTGMGLAICRRIVQNHGGRIWVRSTPGSGSAFIFSVPLVGDQPGPVPPVNLG